MEKTFSIITVVYNAKKDLQKTIESVQDQTFNDFEHIIIDGGSTDGTFEYIKSLKFGNLKYISEKDKGIYDAMNKGIKFSSGEYLLFLNAADIFVSNDILKTVFHNIDQSKPKIIYGGANIYNESGKFLSTLKPMDFTKKNLNRYATRVVCHQAIFAHKYSVIEYSNKYRLKGELNWYYDLLQRIGKDEILQVDEIICNYYLGGTGDKSFWENYFERVKVTKHHNSLVDFVISIPFFMLPIVFRLRRIIFGK